MCLATDRRAGIGNETNDKDISQGCTTVHCLNYAVTVPEGLSPSSCAHLLSHSSPVGRSAPKCWNPLLYRAMPSGSQGREPAVSSPGVRGPTSRQAGLPSSLVRLCLGGTNRRSAPSRPVRQKSRELIFRIRAFAIVCVLGAFLGTCLRKEKKNKSSDSALSHIFDSNLLFVHLGQACFASAIRLYTPLIPPRLFCLPFYFPRREAVCVTFV